MSKWMVSAKKADFHAIAQKFQIDPVIARIIRNRDIVGEEQIERFLHGTLELLHNPAELKDAEAAADILCEKTEAGLPIRIIGDYDIDGVCSTYILISCLEQCGAVVDAVIPHRIQDGYGLNDKLIEEAHEAGIDTILTCDNGIAAANQIAYAKRLGMTVVVTDHHEVPYEVDSDGSRTERLPEADAVVDPKQSGCQYPYKGICGAVVAYKLMQLYLGKMERRPAGRALLGRVQEILQELLAFAAFATVGDVMELTDENRIIVKYGLRQIEQTRNPGLRALMVVNGLQDKGLSVYHIGFVLGPCLNATGRLDTAARALSMFCTKDWAQAVAIAGELKELNDSRKGMTLQETDRAVELIESTNLKEDKVLVVYLPDCHESLAGIIAGRIRERYYRPVFVLTKGEEAVKGSGRSIEAYSMFEEMSRCRELFLKYGGHPMAAGLSISEELVETFRERLNENCTLTAADLTEVIHIDMVLPFSHVSEKLTEELLLLEPFGKGNTKPVFAARNVTVLESRVLGKNQNVLRMKLMDESKTVREGIFFSSCMQEVLEDLQKKPVMHILYYPEMNEFRGQRRLQLRILNYC